MSSYLSVLIWSFVAVAPIAIALRFAARRRSRNGAVLGGCLCGCLGYLVGVVQLGWPLPDVVAWTAIGTVGAVVAALAIAIWGDALRAIYRRPILTVRLKPALPDCLKTEVGAKLPDGTQIPAGHSYFCRLRVENGGRAEAQDVEIQLMRLWQEDAQGKLTEVTEFIPLNLKWAYIGRITLPKLQPGLSRHCDLCHTLRFPDGTLKIILDTDWIPNPLASGTYPTIKDAGVYVIDAAVAADNATLLRPPHGGLAKNASRPDNPAMQSPPPPQRSI